MTVGTKPAVALQRWLACIADVTEQRTGIRPSLPGVELLSERAAFTGMERTVGGSVGGATRTFPAADGWWVLALPRPTDLDLVPALVESGEVSDPWQAVTTWSANRGAAEVVERCQLLGLAAARIPNGPTDSDPQREHRGDQPVVETIGGARAPQPSSPLVVDLSAMWAGPLCARLLGLAGATVVKVESSHRLDGARHGPAAFYDLLHSGHDSVTVDFTTQTGRDHLEALLARADVVIESSRPRAMRQLGICVENYIARGVIWTSITAYGRSGPWSERVGFGDDVAAAAGLVAAIDGVPVPVGDAIADPLAGTAAAAATASALLADTGRLLDVSMRDVARAANDWTAHDDEADYPLRPGVAPAAVSRAAAPGADNDRYLGAAVPT